MRYVAMLRRNGIRHQIDILDVTFSETTPQVRDLDAAQVILVKNGIDAADAKGGKCPGIKAHIVFVPEADLKGTSFEAYLAETAPKLPSKEPRRSAKANPSSSKKEDK